MAGRTVSTHREGDRTILPVTFADGVTVELVYPAELDLEHLEPTSEVVLAVDSGGRSVRRDVRLTRSGAPTEPEGSAGIDYVRLTFGKWEVLVSAATDHGESPLTPVEARAWTEALAVEEAPTGFPIVVLGPRLRLARNPDDQAAPVLLVLGIDLEPGVALSRPDSCGGTALEENERCYAGVSILLAAYGDAEFIDAVSSQVELTAPPA
jgi:hypothetical protein